MGGKKWSSLRYWCIQSLPLPYPNGYIYCPLLTPWVHRRLPTDHPSLIRWSAPIYVEIKLTGGGFAFGKQSNSSFAVCTTSQLEELLFKDEKIHSRRVSGIDFSFSCGSGLSEQSDVISIPFGKGVDVVCVSKTSGAIVGISFMGMCAF